MAAPESRDPILTSLQGALGKARSPGARRFLEATAKRHETFTAGGAVQRATDREELLTEMDELRVLSAGQPTAVADLLEAQRRVIECQLRCLDDAVLVPPPSQETAPPAEEPSQAASETTTPTPAPLEAVNVFPPAFDVPNLVPFTKWAWDQSDSFVTVYLTVDGLTDAAQAHCLFQRTTFDFRCINCAGKNYRLVVPVLCEAVDPPGCRLVVKPGSVRIRLKKAAAGDWTGLDDTEKRKQAQHKQLASSGATTQELLHNMYLQADDKTREELAKAALEGQKKREEQARAAS